MRKLFWRFHSLLGLSCGLALLVIGLSGSLLVFHDDLDAALRPAQTTVVPTAEGRLSFTTLIERVEEAVPGHAVTGWAPRRDRPDRADGVFVIPYGTDRWHYLTVDPYRGTVLSGPAVYASTFKGWLLDLHYTFFLEDLGMAITGVLGVALCLLGVSGLWIYRRFWKSFFCLRWRASLRMLSGDVHRLTGVCSVAFNLLLGFTGAWWNLSHVVEEFGHGPEEAASEFQVPGRLLPDGFELDPLLADAATRIEGFRTEYISLPWAPDGPVTLWGTAAEPEWFRSPYGSQVAYASASGAFLSAHDLRDDPWWPQVVDAFEPLHFGTFGGRPVQVLWAVAGLAPAVLSLSGLTIWWKRRRRPAAPILIRAEEKPLAEVAGG